MGNGLSDYWRKRRVSEREVMVKKRLLNIVESLLRNKPSGSFLLAAIVALSEEDFNGTDDY